MLKLLYNYPKLSIFLLSVCMLAFNANVIPVSIMEARNFISAREMLSDGNWLLTTLNGQARYEKPPLPTWITAAFAYIFGITNVWALRLPAIFMLGVTGIGIYIMSLKLILDKWQSITNAIIGITSFYNIAIIFKAPLDIYTHGFMLIGIYYLWLSFNSTSNYKWLFIASVCIGFSILSKGPVSLYALLIPFLCSYGIVYKFNFKKVSILKILFVITLSLLIGAWWYVYARIQDSEAFLKITSNEADHWSDYHIRPFYYYWSFFIQSGLWTIPALVSLFYPYLKNRVRNLKAFQFSLLWVLISVVLLSIIPEKKSRYLMPVLIPLAINCGFYIEYLLKNFKHLSLKERLIPYIHFGTLSVIAIATPLIILFSFMKHNFNDWINIIILSIIVLISAIYMFYFLKKKNLKQVFIASLVYYFSLLIFGMPLIKYTRENNYRPITSLKTQTEKEGLKMYSLNPVIPEVLWQYGDIIPLILEENKLNIPDEDEFDLLAEDLSDASISILNEQYSVRKIDHFDLNWVGPENTSHKERLTINLFRFKRL